MRGNRSYWTDFAAKCREELLGNVMPFWMKYGWDRKNGGVYTCLDRDGALMDSTKSVWFQGRFGWMTAHAYNKVRIGMGEAASRRFQKQRREWLAASKSCCEFLEKHCFDRDGRAFFEVTAEGVGLRKRRYVFSECFAAMAYAEYALASGETAWARKAVSLFKRIRLFMSEPETYMPAKYTKEMKTQGHSLTMILINVANVLKQVSNDPVLDRQITESVEALVKYFIHPEFKALLETVGPNGEFIDTMAGRTINPGHCIETAWFLMDVAVARKDDALKETALKILDWSWAWGWDGIEGRAKREEVRGDGRAGRPRPAGPGGIISFRDCKGFPPQCYEQDMKFWWPQCEAIIATAYAYKLTGDRKYQKWHRLASTWAWKHLKDRKYPEWYGYLHRDGTVAQPAKGNLYKGPFHIPRMLVKSMEICGSGMKTKQSRKEKGGCMSNKRKHTVKYLVLTVMCTMAMAIGAGTCDVSFEGYKNAVMTDFVVPLYLTEGQDGFSYQGIAAGGADLCVSDVTGGSVVTESLPYEIERWLPSGQSILWVRVPSFSAATVLRLSWGTDQISVPITTGVWRNMWTSLHMGTASNREEGPVGDAAILGNSVMTVNCPSDSVTYSDAFSISFWFKAQSPVKLGYISRIQNSKSGQFAVIYNFEANKIELYKNSAGAEGADPRPFSGIDVPDFDWHHYAYSYDGTTLSCYRDGRFVSASTVAFRLVTENKAGSIHIGGSTSGKDMPTGVLDEYRMSVEPLSLAEIQAMCELQSARYFDAGLDVSFPEFSGSGSLVDFTALVTLNDRVPGFEANAVMKAIDEGTFEIALADTKESLPIERECITTSGTVPELSFWVKIPSLDENTRLHLSWLKTGCSGRAKTDFPMRNVNVWPAESLLVWHMAAKNGGGRPIESVNGGALYPIDGYDKDPAMMDGPTGRYAAMRTAPGTGSSQGTIEVTGKSIDRVYTISFWARKDDFDNPQDGGYAFLMRKDVQRAVIAGYGEGNAFRLYGNGYSYGSSVLQIPDSGWHHYAFVADGNSLSGYCDGVCKFTGGNVLAFGVEELKDWTICLGSSNLAKDAFPGGLDEFRVDTVARSGDWIRTMYRNQLAYREGQSCLNAPGMLSEYSCSKGANAINYSVRMNSKQPSTVTFFYGASDHGEVASGWDHQVDLGTKDGFAVVESQVSGLASKDCLYGRFRAVNEYGTAWSRSIFGRTKTVGVSYGTRVKFPGYVGSSALKDFPVCIRLPASDLLPSTSDKVWVEARDGSSVPYEVETWNPASTSVIWVRVPLLTRGTSVFVRWADDGQPVAWPRSAVWDDKYVRVYHLGPDGKDSSVNAADVVSTGSSADAEGLAGRCRSFTGANGSMATLSRPFVKFGDGFTISLCAKFTGTVKPTYVWQTYGSQQLAMIFGFNGANVELFGDECSGGGAVKELVRGLSLLPSGDDKWHHYAYAYDGQQLKTYKDGSLVGATNLSYALGGKSPDMLDCDLAIGGERSGNNVLNGSLDEICVERVGRSEDWIGACGANMANTLCTIGPYEEISLPYGMVITIR